MERLVVHSQTGMRTKQHIRLRDVTGNVRCNSLRFFGMLDKSSFFHGEGIGDGEASGP
jgi:hypothetical protein